MEKPFDPKGLLEAAKGQGLELAEDTLQVAAKVVLQWVKESVLLTENHWDDFFVTVEPMIEEQLDKQLDKIDGHVG